MDPLRAEIVAAHDESHLETVRGLFREYEQAIGIDLCFQGFEDELAGLPGRYAPPTGGLWLLKVEGRFEGCIALRMLDESTCEMKRLYVRPSLHGRGFGNLLARHAVERARMLGYRRMVLDTLESMVSARALYCKLGFRETGPYTSNPHKAVFMELDLS